VATGAGDGAFLGIEPAARSGAPFAPVPIVSSTQTNLKRTFSSIDRLVFVGPYRLFPKVCDASAIVKPEIIVRWHRAGSDRIGVGSRDRRPTVPLEMRRLLVRSFIRRLRSIGIRDRPTSPRSPWQNECVERLIGSIRRERLDYLIVFSKRHRRHLLLSYMKYYNGAHTHLSLEKDAHRTMQLVKARSGIFLDVAAS
jgi:hypothetical protein